MKYAFFFLALLFAGRLPAQIGYFGLKQFEPKQLEGRIDTIAKTFTPADASYHVSNFVDGYATIRKNGKFGIVSDSGLLIRDIDQELYLYPKATIGMIEVEQPEFQPVMNSIQPPPFPGSYFICDKNGTIIFPRLLGHVQEATLYSGSEKPDGNLLLVQPLERHGGGADYYLNWPNMRSPYHTTTGVINLQGKIVVEPGLYRNIYQFYNGYAIVQSYGNKFGFINAKGKEIVPCIHEQVGIFSEGLAAIREGEKWGCIDTTGKVVIKPKYKWVYEFQHGCAAVSNGEYETYYKYALIDTRGKELTPFRYCELPRYQDGFYLVHVYDKKLSTHQWGWANSKGKEVIPVIYTSARNLENGIAVMCKDKLWGIVDTTGREQFFEYQGTIGISNGMIGMYRDGKWGFIDVQGNVCVPCVYERIFEFRGPLAPVRLNGLWGFVNQKGKLVIACRFDSASQYETGYCWGRSEGGLEYFDPNGKAISKSDVKYAP